MFIVRHFVYSPIPLLCVLRLSVINKEATYLLIILVCNESTNRS